MIEETIASFLRAHAGWWFCHPCLAERLAAGYEDVLAATRRLRLLSGYSVDAGRCFNCERLGVVVVRAPQGAQSGTVPCSVCGKGIVLPADMVFRPRKAVAHRACVPPDD